MERTEKNCTPREPDATDAILESISDGVFTVDNEWRIHSFNRAAEQITGIPRAAAIGQLCSEVFRADMCETACALRTTIQTGQPVINKNGFIVRADGRRIPISVSTAVLRLKNGTIRGGVETFRDLSEIETLREALDDKCTVGELTSRSPVMNGIFGLIHAVAKTDATVLVLGETGSGKELIARAIHGESERRDKPFLAINCGALPETLLESELFGYKKGAFTGAVKDKPGLIARSGNGTLFLDEIGEISQALQVRLLRVLQERSYEPLGGITGEPVRSRIIAATNRNLENLVHEGKFREDLFYRINVVQIPVPPLRARPEDIPLLAERFLTRYAVRHGRKILDVSPAAMQALVAHDWPGNVRELENAIERAVVLAAGNRIESTDLPATVRPGAASEYSGTGTVRPRSTASRDVPGPGSLTGARARGERALIIEALRNENGHRRRTAQALGIHHVTLFRRMKALGIVYPPKNEP